MQTDIFGASYIYGAIGVAIHCREQCLSADTVEDRQNLENSWNLVSFELIYTQKIEIVKTQTCTAIVLYAYMHSATT